MKIKNILLGTFLAAFAFTSCSDDDGNGTNGKNSGVAFKTTIGDGLKSRAAGNAWAGSDAIGIYMKKAGQPLPSNVVNSADNMKHTTPGDGVFTAATPANQITFPGDGSAVDFIAYYPYQTTIASHVYKVNVTNQTAQEAIDLLYTNDATNLTKDHVGGVGMTFNHELVKMIINVKAGAGIGSLAGLNVKVAGMKTQADFALENGALTVTSTTASDITLKSTANGADMLVEAIILPADATSGRVITFTLGSQTFKWSIPDGTKYEKGKKYTYDAILKVDGGVTVVTPNATITDWNDVPSQTIDPELVVEAGDGTEANPYSVADLTAAKVGETTKWLKGYIVGSTAKTKAFPSVSTNVLLAASPTETDEAKCIPIDITGAVQANLDIVANPSLIGKEVKVQGNIVNAFGGVIAMASVIAQEGGAIIGGGGDPEVFFTETFGTAEFTSNPKVGVYTGWDNASLTFSDSYGVTDIRKLKSGDNLTNHIWLPANKDASLKIDGINAAGYKNIKLTFDLAANVFNAGTSIDVNAVKITYNGTVLTVPSKVLSKDGGDANIFYPITVDMSSVAVASTGTLEFFLLGTANTVGVRLDNVKLEGAK